MVAEGTPSPTAGTIGVGMARVAAVFALILGLPILLFGLLDHPFSWQNLPAAAICVGSVGALLGLVWGRILSGLSLILFSLLGAVSSAGTVNGAVNKAHFFAWVFALLAVPFLVGQALWWVSQRRAAASPVERDDQSA